MNKIAFILFVALMATSAAQAACPTMNAAPCGVNCPCPVECPCQPTCCPEVRGLFDGGMCCGGRAVPSLCGC